MALMVFAAGPGAMLGQTDIESLRTRAAQGEPEALNALGSAYANGQGVPQNHADALSLYQQAADRGLASAWFNLGMSHELGHGVAPSPENAFKFYLKAAERGFAPAQFNVGNMYANGVGVKHDLMEAAVWFRQSAELGVPEAQFNLGLAYELGRGVRKDENLAQRWYQMAAALGNARAQFNLALMFEEGRGTAADPVAAMKLYRASAQQNFAPAQNNLGILLAEGRGAPVNLVEAYTWLTLADENGVSSNVLELIAQQLSIPAKAEASASLAQMRAGLGLPQPTATSVITAAMAASSSAAIARPPDATTQELTTLKTRLLAVDSEIEKYRAEGIRLAELARAAEQSRMQAERRLAAAEAEARLSAAEVAATRSARSTLVTTDMDLDKLGMIDPRIAKLMTENGRMSTEIKAFGLEVSQLNAQLRIASQNATLTDGPPPGKITVVANDDRVAALTRRIEVMRNTIDRLAEESRWHANVSADINRLQIENEQLKAGRKRGAAAFRR